MEKIRIDKVVIVHPDLPDEVLEPGLIIDESEPPGYRRTIEKNHPGREVVFVKTECPNT